MGDWGLHSVSYGGKIRNSADYSRVTGSEHDTFSDTSSAHGTKERDVWWLKDVF